MPRPYMTTDEHAMLAGRWAQDAADNLWRNVATVTINDAFEYLAREKHRHAKYRCGDKLVRWRLGLRVQALAPTFPAITPWDK
eukprot:7528149-Pyramimonas_sp.AAC.1